MGVFRVVACAVLYPGGAVRTLSPLLFLAACTGSYDQKDTEDLIGHDSGTTESDADTDADSDTDADADSDTDSDADADADSDADSDTDTDTDTPTTDLCTNSWDPLHEGYWIRYYDMTYNGETATGQQEGYGASWWNGVDAWEVYDEVSTNSGSGFAGTVYYGCDWGGQAGLYMLGWNMSVSMFGLPFTGSAEADRPRMYLPAESDMGTVGSWTFNYSESVSFKGIPLTLTASGTYTERGTEILRLPDGNDYNAYHLFVEYELNNGISVTTGTIDQWYVQGLGLARETNTGYDSSTGSSIDVMTREITSWTGLTPR